MYRNYFNEFTLEIYWCFRHQSTLLDFFGEKTSSLSQHDMMQMNDVWKSGKSHFITANDHPYLESYPLPKPLPLRRHSLLQSLHHRLTSCETNSSLHCHTLSSELDINRFANTSHLS